MRALVIEHDPLSTPERVGEHLERRGVELEPFVVVQDINDPGVTAKFPTGDGHDLVIVMGAPWSAYDSRVQDWVLAEVEFIQSHLGRGTPILGICFGAQLMSISLGGAVFPASLPEYGWGTIDSTEPAIANGPWFQYHGDGFTLPADATALARNDSGLQAFRYGSSLAVQFHPEVTPSLIESWNGAGGEAKLVEVGINPDELIDETVNLVRTSQPALERMLDWWLDDIDNPDRPH